MVHFVKRALLAALLIPLALAAPIARSKTPFTQDIALKTYESDARTGYILPNERRDTGIDIIEEPALESREPLTKEAAQARLDAARREGVHRPPKSRYDGHKLMGIIHGTDTEWGFKQAQPGIDGGLQWRWTLGLRRDHKYSFEKGPYIQQWPIPLRIATGTRLGDLYIKLPALSAAKIAIERQEPKKGHKRVHERRKSVHERRIRVRPLFLPFRKESPGPALDVVVKPKVPETPATTRPQPSTQAQGYGGPHHYRNSDNRLPE